MTEIDPRALRRAAEAVEPIDSYIATRISEYAAEAETVQRLGDLAPVKAAYESAYDGPAELDNLTTSSKTFYKRFYDAAREDTASEDAKFAEGDRVVVTGDIEGMCHALAAGSGGVITRIGKDRIHNVTADGGRRMWVHENDLTSPPPVQVFTTGDRVIVTGDTENMGHRFYVGTVGVIVARVEYNHISYRVEANDTYWYVHRNDLKLAPSFSVGDRVKVIAPASTVGGQSCYLTEGDIGTVDDIDDSAHYNQGNVMVATATQTAGQWIDPAKLERVPAPRFVVGDRVRLTEPGRTFGGGYCHHSRGDIGVVIADTGVMSPNVSVEVGGLEQYTDPAILELASEPRVWQSVDDIPDGVDLIRDADGDTWGRNDFEEESDEEDWPHGDFYAPFTEVI